MMKKWCLFLCAYFSLCLLAACAAGSGERENVPSGMPSEETLSGGEAAEPGQVTQTFRLVTSGGSGQSAILAGTDDTGSDVYTLDISRVADVSMEGMSEEEMAILDWAPMAGALVEVTWDGTVMESYPCQFGEVSAVRLLEDGFDDTCRLYLDVLADLWEADSGLNENITELGVDLSATRLSRSEQAAVAYAFGTAHDLMAMETTYNDLAENGYLAPVSLGDSADPGGEDPQLYQWESGCLFSITEREEPVIFNEAAMGPMTDGVAHEGIRFDAEKWRGPLAAYSFYNCTAVRAAGGAWGDYTAEAEMVA